MTVVHSMGPWLNLRGDASFAEQGLARGLQHVPEDRAPAFRNHPRPRDPAPRLPGRQTVPSFQHDDFHLPEAHLLRLWAHAASSCVRTDPPTQSSWQHALRGLLLDRGTWEFVFFFFFFFLKYGMLHVDFVIYFL